MNDSSSTPQKYGVLHLPPLVYASLVYLLLPGVIFVFGWVRPVYAAPIALMLVFAAFLVCVRAAGTQSLIRKKTEMRRSDVLQLGAILLVALYVTESIGLTGHVPQHMDLMFRNPIYDTLVREPWPIYNCNGDYFVYYHAFYLPPALLSKYVQGFISPLTVLYLWCYVGIALSFVLFFSRLKKYVFVFLAVLLLYESISHNVSEISRRYELTLAAQDYLYKRFDSGFNLNLVFHQLRNTYNHAIPGMLLLALMMSRTLPARYALIPCALTFVQSPLFALALIPYLGVYYLLQFVRYRVVPVNLPTLLCLPFLLVTCLYFLGKKAASSCLIWQSVRGGADCSFFSQFPYVVVPILGFLLPFACVWLTRVRKSSLCYVVVLTLILIFFVWIGRSLNELLFKGGLILAILQAYLMTFVWKIGRVKGKVLVLIFLISGIYYASRGHLNLVRSFTLNPERIQMNLRNDWGGHLNHPGTYEYMNFFGENRFPQLLR